MYNKSIRYFLYFYMSDKLKNTLIPLLLLVFFLGAFGGGLVGGLLGPNTSFALSWPFTLSKNAKQPVAPNNGGITIPPIQNQTVSAPEEEAVVNAVAKANPAVVSIVITKKITQYFRTNRNPFADDPFFKQFFGDTNPFGDNQSPTDQPPKTTEQKVGAGTGFFVTADGLLVTNKHVAQDTEASYTVVLNDGNQLPATVLAVDPNNDLALLKVKGNGFATIPFGDSDKIRLGQTVIAIGNALGEYRNTVTRGVVSGLSRTIVAGSPTGTAEQLEGVIQTDAAINPGNSGGPLINLSGQLIGVNTAVNQGGQSLGFALPSNLVRSMIESVQKYGKVVRARLGVRFMPITKELKENNNLPVDYGALVVRGQNTTDLAVQPGSPADKAGIKENDIILEADGQKLTVERTLSGVMKKKKPGDKITLKVWHAGVQNTVNITLDSF